MTHMQENNSRPNIFSQNKNFWGITRYTILLLFFSVLMMNNSAGATEPIYPEYAQSDPSPSQEGEDDPLPGGEEEQPEPEEALEPPVEESPQPSEAEASSEEEQPSDEVELEAPNPSESQPPATEEEAVESEDSEAAPEQTESQSEQAAPEAQPVVVEEEIPEPAAEPISIEEITLSPEPVPFSKIDNFEVIDNFDASIWQPIAGDTLQPSVVRYSSRFATQGLQSLEITAPVTPLTAENEGTTNAVRWSRQLFQPVNWEAVELITVDIYVEERIAEMPTIDLILRNDAGDQIIVERAGQTPLKQWENHQVTFLMNSIPAEIRSQVSDIGFQLRDYNDGQFGPP
ncbi:MAG: hypothetical protein AAF633_22940, partial [Chloroflexota bacterium]